MGSGSDTSVWDIGIALILCPRNKHRFCWSCWREAQAQAAMIPIPTSMRPNDVKMGFGQGFWTPKLAVFSIYFYGVSAATFHPSVWIATFWCFQTAEWISHRLQRVRRPQSQTESLSALCESHQAVQTHLEAHETQLWEGHGFEHGDAAESQLFFWMLICGWS